MSQKIFKESTLHIGIIIFLGIFGYVLGFCVFITGSLVMAGNEGSSRFILVFIFNAVARPFSALVIFGPWGIGFGWTFLLIVAATCKRLIAITLFLSLMVFAVVLTEKQFPALLSFNEIFATNECCIYSSRTNYLFVLPSLILILSFFILVSVKAEKKIELVS